MSLSYLMTLAFAAFLLATLAVKFWLASRQIRHVALHRASVPAAFAHRVPLTAHQKAADYTITKTRFGLLETAFGAAVLLGWTLLGGLDALNQWLLGLLGEGMVQQLALVALFTLAGGALELPFTLYQTFVIEQRFGFNKMTWRLWVADAIKGLLLGIALGLPLLWVVLWLMAAGGRWWWLYAWAFLAAYQLFVMWIAPRVILPLFNKFTPLQDETLKQRVTRLMERCGFAAKGLFVMDGSKRSAHANAFFTGFGANKRVVFFDTLLAQLSHGEMEAVLAHELGHFKRRHIVKRTVSGFLISLLAFALLGWLSQQAWFYTGLGVRPSLGAPNDALALLLFMVAVPVFSFFVSPMFAQLSRKHEFEADAYAVEHASGQDLSAALLKLYEDNASTLTPDPLFVKFYYSHPPASERLARMATA
ncbi:M48 family metallopeptidase [Ramlibacter solisilvae]|uniref:Peptidase M48 n=1 Tax=Ramlibacter tataouinensis TaxID=94132 RepID=A0A127JWR8_9BURK|nr:M48 family metallopeptidase [Ramlibacter tataouinensis]AMO24345.1 peptidase M48 [Ramlibacter tataouinensis]